MTVVQYLFDTYGYSTTYSYLNLYVIVYGKAMEFAIPISRFDPTHVQWGSPRVGPFRRTIPFGYDENQISFNTLSIVLQPLRIVELDWSKNQLVLEETKKMSYLSKLEQLQTIVSAGLEKNSKQWLEGSTTFSGTKLPLQLWLKSRKLTLYLSAQPENLPFFTEDGPAVFSDKTIQPGDLIRAIVRIQGISLQMSDDDIWTGKSRIQHHVLQLYKVTEDP